MLIINGVIINCSYLDCWITFIFLNEEADMFGLILGFTNMVMCVWVPSDILCLRLVHREVLSTDSTNTCLTMLNLCYLPNKLFAISSWVSRFQ